MRLWPWLIALVPHVLSCGGRSIAADGGTDGGRPDVCEEDVSIAEAHSRECGFIGPWWCGACEAPRWCDQVNGACREPTGSCGQCPESCALNGRCLASACEGEYCDEKVPIPEGDVLMGRAGSPGGTWSAWVDAFRIDRYEVTVARYRRCVDFHSCNPPTSDAVGQREPGAFRDEAYDLFPVADVAPEDALTFCAWEGGWLPSRAEWVKAARGGCALLGTAACVVEEGDAADYPWGDEPPQCTRVNGGDPRSADYCAGRPEPVGSFPAGASPYGAEDMLGNVGEVFDTPCGSAPWCANDLDWHSPLSSFNIWISSPRSSGSGGDGFRCAFPP